MNKHRHRILYVRANKKDNNEQMQAVIDSHKINECLYEDVTDNEKKRTELNKLLRRIDESCAIFVSEMGVIAEDPFEFCKIHDRIVSKGAILFCVKENMWSETNSMNKFVEVVKSQKQFRTEEVTKVQRLIETVPGNPYKRREIITNDVVVNGLQKVADGRVTMAQLSEELGVSAPTLYKVRKDRIASGDVIESSPSEKKIVEAKKLMPKNWKRAYDGYKNGSITFKNLMEVTKLTSHNVRKLINYQKAGYLN